MPRKKKAINHSLYPDHAIEAIARCLWPDIQSYYESQEGQREFSEWKTRKEKEQQPEEIQLAA